MDRQPEHQQRYVAQIQLLQRLMSRASAAGDQAELNRLAGLMESHTVTTTRLAPWFARELVRGWIAHLPTGSPNDPGLHQ
jgi:hypothetical protein